jgi:transcriptional regulator with XRE-family HTH domain
MTFGQRLKKLRREHDMTQERLADYLGVTPQAVSRWETDAVMPDITLLPAFANLFHVTTDYLLGVSDIPNPYRDKRKKQ